MRDCIGSPHANAFYAAAEEAEGAEEGAALETGDVPEADAGGRERRVTRTLARLTDRLQAFDALLFALDMALDGLTHEAERNALGCLVVRLQEDFDGIRRERDWLVGELGEEG